MAPRPYVAVVGSGHAPPDECAAAEAVGRGLGGAGAVLVCGGLGGVMEAACRGAARGGRPDRRPAAGRRSRGCQPWVGGGDPDRHGRGAQRLVVRAADAVIAVGGEWGTLPEVALALKGGTPVIGLGTWELPREGVVRVNSAEEAVARALAR